MFLQNVSLLARSSHALVRVQCQGGLNNCRGEYDVPYAEALRTMAVQNDSFVCRLCVSEQDPENRNGDELLSTVDTEEKAYLLGWMTTGLLRSKVGPAGPPPCRIMTGMGDMDCIKKLRDIYGFNVPISGRAGQSAFFDIDRPSILNDAREAIGVGTNCSVSVSFAGFSNDSLNRAFLRGYFEANGNISHFDVNQEPKASFPEEDPALMLFFLKLCGIPASVHEDELAPSTKSARFEGVNAIDFLGYIYQDCGHLRLDSFYNAHVAWLTGSPSGTIRLPECQVLKTHVDAVLPSKPKTSDVGYDLTVIREAKRMLNNVTLYDTGLQVRVGHGLYAEIVPRSSLSKSGYMMANSVGIIDPSYNGNLFIALVKVDPSAKDIELPFRCCQLIFRRQVHVDMVEVSRSFESTARGSGGFGSSGTR